ncbi:IS30 family transposase, partial [Aporhodopirellula rubra]
QSAVVMNRILDMFKGIDPSKIRTMTFDNGTEFFYHKMISDAINVKIYFADPYKSYQRGTNENTNGLIRQYFPKHLNYGYISWQQVAKVQEQLNSRPRRRLRFQTPMSQFQ